MVCINDISSELFDLVLEELRHYGSSLASLAATSKHCQAHVERLNFQELTVTHSNLANFDLIINEQRFSAIRRLSYDISTLLDEHEDGDLDRDGMVLRVTQEEVFAQNTSFTAGFERLLRVLSKMNGRTPNHLGMHLDVMKSKRHCSKPYLLPDPGVNKLDERNMHRAWVKLNDHDLLDDMDVPAITSFSCKVYAYQKAVIWPASWTTLLRKFPCLNSASIAAYDEERKDLVGRRKARDAFAAGLRSLPKSLTNIALNYTSRPPEDHGYQPPSLLDTALGRDNFSFELSGLSKRLTRLELVGPVLDLVGFFRQVDDWKSLEFLDMEYISSASAAGTWYFKLDPRIAMAEHEEDNPRDEDTFEEMYEQVEDDMLREEDIPPAMDLHMDPFRTVMDPAEFDKVYVAMANAVKRMPKIRRLTFDFQSVGDAEFGNGIHQFRFLTGDSAEVIENITMTHLQASWYIEPRVEDLSKVVKQAWKEIGELSNQSISLSITDQQFFSGLQPVS